MNCRNRKKYLVANLVAAIATVSAVQAQEHFPFSYGQPIVRLADDQLQQDLYKLSAYNAQRAIDALLAQSDAFLWQDDKQKAIYTRTLANIKRGDITSVAQAVAILENITAHPQHERLALALGQFYFVRNQYADAIFFYEQAGIDNLSNTEIADAKFELAYCYFNTSQFDKAEPLFAIMKDVNGKYQSAGYYYYGLLAYNRGAFEDALKSFDHIDDLPQYRTVVPYYMAELEYFLGRRDKALSEAQKLIKRSEKSYYHNELHLLAAQCLFENKQYGEALPYFEYYYEHTEKIRKEDLYEIGYSYYQVGEWKNAIERFKPLSTTKDSLGQTAMYLLGDCYLKTFDKRSARNAFGICANMQYNQELKYAAQLLYAKISYELGYNDDALRSINQLLADKPNDKEGLLLKSQLLAATSNYKAAYEALLQTQADNEAYADVMQRVAYSYALQQIPIHNDLLADSLLSVSLKYAKQPAYAAAANFWKSELAYTQNNYESTLQYGNAFLALAPNANPQSVSNEANLSNAYLNMGYASLGLKDYATAQTYFAKAGANGTESTIANASLREADAAFMQKDFSKALTLYTQNAAGKGNDAEYAMLQQAITYGILGRNAEKIAILQSMTNAVPAGSYTNDARYELAITELAANKYQQAITTLEPLTTNTNAKQLAPKALLKIAFAYQQLNNDNKAIEAYRKILKEFAASPERADAQDALKSIYIERNQPDVYAQILSENNITQEDKELENAFYSSAEGQFAAQKYTAAKDGFEKYLQKYPNSAQSVKAHFYAAESYYNLKQPKDALPHYEAVVATEWNDFSEPSAKRSAEIAFATNNYAKSLKYYQALRGHAMTSENIIVAFTGMMRSEEKQNNLTGASSYADTLLTLPDVPLVLLDEAKLIKAHQLQAAGKNDEAAMLLQTLQNSNNAQIAAEGRYFAAERLLVANKLTEAEEAAVKNIKQSAGNEYWVVKSYLLLADVFTKQKDYFNAKATLQSVVQNCKIDALKSEANRKLEELKSLENTKLTND